MIGKSIKDSDFIDVLELLDLEIIYEFDRFGEGTKDIYWIKDLKGGCTFRANEKQVIDTSFVYLRAYDGHKKFKHKLPGITIIKNAILELGSPANS